MTVNARKTIEIFRPCYYFTSHLGLGKLSNESIEQFYTVKINSPRLTQFNSRWWQRREQPKVVKTLLQQHFSEHPAGWCNQFNPATVCKLLLQ